MTIHSQDVCHVCVGLNRLTSRELHEGAVHDVKRDWGVMCMCRGKEGTPGQARS